MAQKTLETLFHDTLKDLYYAERKISKTLPKMARGAQSEELKAAFQKHKEETDGQIERLQQVFEIAGKRAQGKTCPAIDGIIEEGEEILDEYKDTAALDAGLLAAAQAVEHYEITRYGTLKRWAEVLGMQDAAKLLDQSLQEESKTDELLSQLADQVGEREGDRRRMTRKAPSTRGAVLLPVGGEHEEAGLHPDPDRARAEPSRPALEHVGGAGLGRRRSGGKRIACARRAARDADCRVRSLARRCSERRASRPSPPECVGPLWRAEPSRRLPAALKGSDMNPDLIAGVGVPVEDPVPRPPPTPDPGPNPYPDPRPDPVPPYPADPDLPDLPDPGRTTPPVYSV